MPEYEKSLHVVRLGREWCIKSNGLLLSSYNTQQNAIKSAIMIAKRLHSEVVIYDREGRIRSKESFGPNSFSSKDTEH